MSHEASLFYVSGYRFVPTLLYSSQTKLYMYMLALTLDR